MLVLAAEGLYFNPRPPRGGRQELAAHPENGQKISIHAPREGGDPEMLGKPGWGQLFQSTPPARGATTVKRLLGNKAKFQSTPPARGATPAG